MTKRTFVLWSVLAVLAFTRPAGAQESLRITPTVRDGRVLVSFELTDAFNQAVQEAIASGLRTTFSYELELRTVVPGWIDRTIAKTVVTTSDQYDNLTRRHTLTRTIDGRIEDETVTDDESVVRAWLTKWNRVPVSETSKLDPTRRLLRAHHHAGEASRRVAARIDEKRQRIRQIHVHPLNAEREGFSRAPRPFGARRLQPSALLLHSQHQNCRHRRHGELQPDSRRDGGQHGRHEQRGDGPGPAGIRQPRPCPPAIAFASRKNTGVRTIRSYSKT